MKFEKITIPKRQNFKRPNFIILISKRQRFIISAFLLSIGLLAIQFANISWRYQAIFGLTVLTYILSAWSLKEGLSGIEWLTVLILPTLFTSGVGLFYFLLPSSWLARLPIAVLYGLGLYALLLTENIFAVAAIRNIQLLRAAHAVGFLLTLLTGFFLYNTILSFRFSFWLNFVLVFIASLPLLIQGLWSINLEEKISQQIWFYSVALSLIIAEGALALSFWPVTVSASSLALITIMYVVLGLTQHQLSQRLFKRTINEYLLVGIVVLAVIILTTQWGG
ncbi:hypothetical protein A2Z41_02885 [Microgenomates group bacterium RBG_19FT_COMBO_39_10]|nr:MAG: hypothetical protein A2Z41_02885 [Microgenomates group bacterium RBG_19FT_COMBO_39_10]